MFFYSGPNAFFSTLITKNPELKAVVNAVTYNIITIGAMGGYLFVMGPGFYGQASVPGWVNGAGWFYVDSSPALSQGGNFAVTLNYNNMTLKLSNQWTVVWQFQSAQGVEMGLDGTWQGTWWVQTY